MSIPPDEGITAMLSNASETGRHGCRSRRIVDAGRGGIADPSTGTWLILLSGWLAISLIAAGSTVIAAEPAPSAATAGPTLHMVNGGFAVGALKESPKPERLVFQAKGFVAPFEFATGSVSSLDWPLPATLPKPLGDFCFELSGGDVLFGALLALDEKTARIEAPGIGPIKIARSELHRIHRWHADDDVIYLGPNGLIGWRETSKQKGWKEETGQPFTDVQGAAIQGDFHLPARAAIEFEISWKTKPDFVFAFGVSDNESTIKRAFRFEAWGGDLVLQRELEREADLAVVQDIGSGPGRTHLQLYLDQEQGRALVYSPSGKQLADLKVPSAKPVALPGLYLGNVRGDLRLEWLRIGRWNGDIPREVRLDQARVHGSDGAIGYGQVTRFDPATKQFTLRGDKGDSVVEQGKLSSIYLSVPRDEQPRACRVIYFNGTRLSGELVKIDSKAIWVKLPGVDSPLALPFDGVRSLAMLKHESPSTPESGTARLELDGVRLPGKLVDGQEKADASSLAWLPSGSSMPSPLRPDAAGRVVYREPKPVTPARTNQSNVNARVQQQNPVNVIARFAQALTETQPSEPTKPDEKRSLYLRSGDVIPSIIKAIDENGVTFESSMSTSTFVPSAKVKAVELAAETNLDVRLTGEAGKVKRERLLTLPRMQKGSPPTHLIRSRNGDYLRGRVILLDDKKMRVEVRLDTKELPRDRIARVIWLHEDELDPSKTAAPTSKATRVQAIRNDGVRVTFMPEKVAEGALIGKSDVLGACRVRLSDIDQLLIGAGIEQAASQLVYQQWKLKNAPEPTLPTPEGGDSSGSGNSGKESPLVGKPAPDFRLDLLDGKTFELAKTKGQVVVLDFWATWCGPCLQAMPQVDKVTREFAEADVRLVAVNLQEAAPQIKSMLERHKLHMAVALDRDGVVADKYGAVAIPQTVVIDREGKVVRLFVGSSPHLGDQLREAIKGALNPSAAKAAASPAATLAPASAKAK
jgi:peroxiredoxin